MASHDGNDFSSSLTDLMTSLAIVFLILAVGLVIVNTLQSSENEQRGKQYEEDSKNIKVSKATLLTKIKEAFKIKSDQEFSITADRCVEVDASNDYSIVVRFNGSEKECLKSGLFFEENKFFLKTENVKQNILNLASLYETICTSSEINANVERVQIVGHTDSKKYKDDATCSDPSISFDGRKSKDDSDLQCGNLYLSAQRARTVFLLVGGHIGRRENLKCFGSKTQISGRGPFEPKLDSNTKRVLDKNDNQHKRVEIVFDFRQPLTGKKGI
jgi:flagellar motor protein MotB